jgi:DeoR/GlpR family transcriptional regulator of sugar metabolism
MTSATDERRELILQYLTDHQIVTVAALTELLGVSAVSIRRDLDRLAQLGLLKRTHGGAVAFPGAARGQPHAEKMARHVEEKERIGQAAAQMIGDGDQVMLDSGSTVLQVARSISGDLLNVGSLTVITGCMPVARELGPWNGVHLIILGGIYLPEQEVVVGPSTVQDLQTLHADKLFIGSDGLTFSHGVTTANMLEAEVNRAMVEAASEVIVVADSSKIGEIGLTTILPLTDIDMLITDRQAPADFVDRLREQQIEVILA